MTDNKAVSATEAVATLSEWLKAHSATVHFLLSGRPGDEDEAHWQAAHRVAHKQQSDAIERAIAVVDAAKKYGTACETQRGPVDIRQLLDTYAESILNQEYADKTHRAAATKVALEWRDTVIKAFEGRP